MPSDPQYAIGYVSRVTGLSAHILRVWEKRYGAVTPMRSVSNRRLYADDDIERLRLIARLRKAGHRVSLLAPLDLAALHRLDRPVDGPPIPEEAEISLFPQHAAVAHANRCRSAVEAMQPEQLDHCLRRAAADLPRLSLLSDVISPLLEGIGETWEKGDIGIAHEHLAVSVVRGFLLSCLSSVCAHPQAPVAIAGTLAGQHCELGALMAAVVAADNGWRVAFFGSDLPLEEIAAAAQTLGADAILLSIVKEVAEDELFRCLSALTQGLAATIRVHLGGRGLPPSCRRIEQLGIKCHSDLSRLGGALEEGRSAGGIYTGELQ